MLISRRELSQRSSSFSCRKGAAAPLRQGLRPPPLRSGPAGDAFTPLMTERMQASQTGPTDESTGSVDHAGTPPPTMAPDLVSRCCWGTRGRERASGDRGGIRGRRSRRGHRQSTRGPRSNLAITSEELVGNTIGRCLPGPITLNRRFSPSPCGIPPDAEFSEGDW